MSLPTYLDIDPKLVDVVKFEGINFIFTWIGALVRLVHGLMLQDDPIVISQILDAIMLGLLPLGYTISRVWARMRQQAEPPKVVLITGAGGEGLGAMLALQ